jgi:hypothetical protein
MSIQQVPAVEPISDTATDWSPAFKLAFRLCFIYLGLYCLSTQIISGLLVFPVIEVPDLSAIWPLKQMVFWTAAHVFRVGSPLVFTGSGSGDKTFDWVLVFCLLIISVIATAVWSAWDRKRLNYAGLLKYFRIFIRFALAGQMIAYGMVKAVPLQMPFPSLTRLLEPYGNFSPMGVLWYSIGASPGYEMFAGCAEILGGVLLIVPRTTMLGALICLMDSVQIFALNMTYDVPVKLLSLHLILISLFVLAPDFRRLAEFLFLNRATGPSTTLPIFRSARGGRIGLWAQIAFGLWLLGMNAYGSHKSWYEYGGGRPKSLLYGIWDVERMSINGQVRAPLTTDYGRWRRVIFDFPQAIAFQRMDSSVLSYAAAINGEHRTITLTKSGDKKWKANFTFERNAADQLTLDGDIDNQKIQMHLKLFERSRFLLVSRGFHWIQEFPFNR